MNPINPYAPSSPMHEAFNEGIAAATNLARTHASSQAAMCPDPEMAKRMAAASLVDRLKTRAEGLRQEAAAMEGLAKFAAAMEGTEAVHAIFALLFDQRR